MEQNYETTCVPPRFFHSISTKYCTYFKSLFLAESTNFHCFSYVYLGCPFKHLGVITSIILYLKICYVFVSNWKRNIIHLCTYSWGMACIKSLTMKVLLVSKINPRLSHSSDVHLKCDCLGIINGVGVTVRYVGLVSDI